jgi:hypothetical protein
LKRIIILLLLIPSTILAETQTLGFGDFSHYLCQKFETLKNNPQYSYGNSWTKADQQKLYQQNGFDSSGRKNFGPTSSNGNPYSKIAQTTPGDDRNYLVNKAMSMLGVFATSFVSLSGTTEAPQAAAQLQTQSTELASVAQTLSQPQTVTTYTGPNGTNPVTTVYPADPTNSQTLQNASNNLKTEANNLEAGNTPGATTAANDVVNSPQQYVSPAYTPPDNSTAILASIASVLETVGTVLLTAYFGPAGAMIGTAANSLINGIVFNQSSSSSTNSTSSLVGLVNLSAAQGTQALLPNNNSSGLQPPVLPAQSEQSGPAAQVQPAGSAPQVQPVVPPVQVGNTVIPPALQQAPGVGNVQSVNVTGTGSAPSVGH